jgi:hypothetical protein
MKDKTDYDCPICRKKSVSMKRSPTPPVPGIEEWPREHNSRKRMYMSILVVCFCAAAGLMTYKIITE